MTFSAMEQLRCVRFLIKINIATLATLLVREQKLFVSFGQSIQKWESQKESSPA